jgi:hypothetical protein
MTRSVPSPAAGAVWRRRVAVGLAAALALGLTSPAEAYLKFGSMVGGRQVGLRWNRQPVRFYITDVGAPGVTSSQVRDAVDQSFATWARVPTAALTWQDLGMTGKAPVRGDGLSVLGFESRPDLDKVLGSTSFTIDSYTGEMVEADIFFNTAFPWSVSSGGERGRYDLQSIATHEIGHLLGLGHSAIGETEVIPGGRRVIAAGTVMFPIAFSSGSIEDRTLRPDDIAGIGDVYPGPGFGDKGSISGRIALAGRGVYGAHVQAFNVQTGNLVGGFSLSSTGAFAIAGLDAGAYVLRIEPVDDADLASFFDPDGPTVDLGFRATYAEQLVIVPKGGGADTGEIKVVAR